MSTERGRTTIETATWASIQNATYDGDGYPCGCYPSRKEPHMRFHLCDYHEGYDEGIAFLTADLAQERALADRLAVALAAQGSASFDEDTNLHIKRLALDAFKEARHEQ